MLEYKTPREVYLEVFRISALHTEIPMATVTASLSLNFSNLSMLVKSVIEPVIEAFK